MSIILSGYSEESLLDLATSLNIKVPYNASKKQIIRLLEPIYGTNDDIYGTNEYMSNLDRMDDLRSEGQRQKKVDIAEKYEKTQPPFFDMDIKSILKYCEKTDIDKKQKKRCDDHELWKHLIYRDYPDIDIALYNNNDITKDLYIQIAKFEILRSRILNTDTIKDAVWLIITGTLSTLFPEYPYNSSNYLSFQPNTFSSLYRNSSPNSHYLITNSVRDGFVTLLNPIRLRDELIRSYHSCFLSLRDSLVYHLNLLTPEQKLSLGLQNYSTDSFRNFSSYIITLGPSHFDLFIKNPYHHLSSNPSLYFDSSHNLYSLDNFFVNSLTDILTLTFFNSNSLQLSLTLSNFL